MDLLSVWCECTDCECGNFVDAYDGQYEDDELIVCEDCLFGDHQA